MPMANPGTDVMTYDFKNIFVKKAKNSAFLTKTKINFTENCRKSQKIVILTSTAGAYPKASDFTTTMLPRAFYKYVNVGRRKYFCIQNASGDSKCCKFLHASAVKSYSSIFRGLKKHSSSLPAL
jgi:hypothetical protein